MGLICKESRAILQKYFNTQFVKTMFCKNNVFTIQKVSETRVQQCVRHYDPRHTAEGNRAGVRGANYHSASLIRALTSGNVP